MTIESRNITDVYQNFAGSPVREFALPTLEEVKSSAKMVAAVALICFACLALCIVASHISVFLVPAVVLLGFKAYTSLISKPKQLEKLDDSESYIQLIRKQPEKSNDSGNYIQSEKSDDLESYIQLIQPEKRNLNLLHDSNLDWSYIVRKNS